MLKLFDKNHNALGILSGYKDFYIEETLKEGTKSLSFKVSSTNPMVDKIQEEGYIQTADYEYVIKQFNKSGNDYYEVAADPNVEELKGTPLQKFEAKTKTAAGCVALALAHVPTWTYEDKSTVTKQRTLRKENGTVKEIIDYTKSVFGIELEYNTLEKKVYIYDQRGSDKGVFFTNEHDMSQFTVQSDTHDFVTRLYAFGANTADGTPLTIKHVNDGLEYVENHQYSDKVISAIWIDQRYTVPENLRDDAIEKLKELSVPSRSYSCNIYTLDKDVKIGDTITFMDSLKKTREKQRVQKIISYPYEPEKDRVELCNTRISFVDKQQMLQEAAQLIQDNTDDAGNIIVNGSGGGGGGISQIPDPLVINKIIAAEGEIGNLLSESIETTDLTATNIKGGNANIPTIDSKQITTETINVTQAIQAASLTVTGAFIGTLTSENFKAGSIDTGILKAEAGWIKEGWIADGVIGSAQIADGSITDAKIVELTANKITAGTLSVERLVISGNDKSIVYAINNMGDLVSTSVDSIDGGVLTDRSVTADKIVAGAITSAEIATNSIKANHIQAGAITSEKIAAGTIDSVNISTNAIKTGHVDAYAITAEKIAAGAITSDKIRGKSITLGNLSDDLFDALNQKIIEEVGNQLLGTEQYMAFTPENGLILGSVNDNFKVQIYSEGINFKDGNNTVAYINNQKFSITDGEILNEFRIGNYVFKPRANGNMSLIYDKK